MSAPGVMARTHRKLHQLSKISCNARLYRGYNSVAVICGGYVGRVTFSSSTPAVEERATIDWVRGLGLLAPVVVDHGHDEQAEILIYEELEGRVGDLTRPAIGSVASQLAVLHRTADMPKHLKCASGLWQRCHEALAAANAECMPDWVRSAIERCISEWSDESAVHGDVREANLVQLDSEGTVGLIDWADAQRGPREADFAYIPSVWWEEAELAYSNAGGQQLNPSLILGHSAARIFALAARGVVSASEVSEWIQTASSRA